MLNQASHKKRILLVDDQAVYWTATSMEFKDYEFHWTHSPYVAKIMLKHQAPNFFDLIMIDMLGVIKGVESGVDVLDIIPCLKKKHYNAVCVSHSPDFKGKTRLPFYMKDDLNICFEEML